MRYQPMHKQRIRAKILKQAARLFRRAGYAGVGIETIMNAASLTRGGFYGYFGSKSQLFAAVMAQPHDFVERLRRRRGKDRAALLAQAEEVIAGYLHPNHRRKVGEGCSLASLSVDVARQRAPAKQAFEVGLKHLCAELARHKHAQESFDTLPSRPEPETLTAVALCVGGLNLARAVHDEQLAEDILASCQRLACTQLQNLS